MIGAAFRSWSPLRHTRATSEELVAPAPGWAFHARARQCASSLWERAPAARSPFPILGLRPRPPPGGMGVTLRVAAAGASWLVAPHSRLRERKLSAPGASSVPHGAPA